MVNKSDSGSSALEASTFGGRMPAGSGDLAIETHGITPVPEDNRYGTPRRLFTVWFAPQMNMTGVFTGSLAIVFGLGFWLGLLAMVIGTLLGSLPVAYLSTWGPRTGTGQLPASRMAFGATVVLPAIVQWLSSIAWDGLVGLFGGEALSTLLHIPFWVGVLIVLALQGAVGIFGYELIHRVEAVMTVVLVITFAVLTIKLLSGNHQIVTPPTVHHGALAGSFVLEVTVALSLAISWASYASDYSRYLPPSTPRKPVFWYSLGGIVLGYICIQAIGIAGAKALGAETAVGVRDIMGGGFLGALALVVIALASVGSNVMNDYSGSLALQTVGVRVRRPVSALVVTVIAFFLILWMHGGDTASRFQNVLLFVGYQGKGTLGAHLQEGATTVRLDGQVRTVRCQVRSISGFSAHADESELLDWLGHFAAGKRPGDPGYPRRVFLVHGDPEGQLALEPKVRELGFATHVPHWHERVSLD